MNNMIRSQMFLCKKRLFTILLCILLPLLAMFFALSLNENIVSVFESGTLIAMVGVMMIPSLVLSYSYIERTQLYEIMAGFSPHQILLGKAIVYLLFSLLYLFVISAEVLCFDRSSDTVLRLALYWIICIRAVLSVVLLSPLLKEVAAAPIFTLMMLVAFGDVNNLAHSPMSVCFSAQAALLGTEITSELIVKVIVSAVAACIIYYLVGYFTLKKKIELEPHQIS